MGNAQVLDVILRYIRFPDCKWTDKFYRSEEVAISRWAATEIISEIIANMNVPATQIVAEFYSRMVRFAQRSNSPRQKRVFKIAADAADEISAML